MLGWNRVFEHAPRARLIGRRLASIFRAAAPAPPPSPLPHGFDWRAYVDRYEDLRAAGIDDETKAIEHWLVHGRPEGRQYRPPSKPTVTAMGCASVDSLYLRASGTLVCWHDAGGDTPLQAFDGTRDYAHDVWLGPVYERIRGSLRSERLPFPDSCQRCSALRCRTRSSTYATDDRVVEHMEIEPTVSCTLECPGCFDQELRRAIPGSRTLPPEVLRKVLGDMARASVRIKVIDFQGHGEPLMCRGLWELTRTARALQPRSYITVCTSGNGIVRSGASGAGVDEVVCSIDGCDADSYRRYRVHGDFDRAMDFMRACAAESRAAGGSPRVVWKYILFEHSSSPSQLLRAQQLALDAGVHEMAFVFTTNGPRARGVTEPDHVPRLGGPLSIRFDHHAPSSGNLEDALDLAAVRLDAGDEPGAIELLLVVARNLERHFQDGSTLPAPHAEVLEALRQVAARLTTADAVLRPVAELP